MKQWVINIGVGIALLVAPAAHATIDNDQLIEGAKLCTSHLSRYERQYGIPTHLLSAMAATESGRYHKGLKIKLPWPWTINAAGKGYVFDTKQEAIAAVRKFRARGIQSIDIGCMQVNLYHHASAFSSLEQAFEPEKNVAYAASFLRNLYQTTGSWKEAASDYHSKTPSRGREYAGEVYNSWYKIIEKVRAAKLAVPESSVVAMNQMKNNSYVRPAKLHVADSKPRKTTTFAALSTRNISVSKKTTHENGVIIVRPEIKLADANALGMLEPSAGEITTVKAPAIKAAATNVVKTSAPKSGPNFIFND